ncbi:hypothetical protein Ndes2437B_g02227 [Nannochloris sp. 'desiccata']
MATEGKVHGGTSVWQSIKSALPFSGQKPLVSAQPVPSKSSADTNKRLDVQASSTVLDRNAFSDISSNGNQAPEDRAAQNAAPQPSAAPTFGYSRNLDKRFRIQRELARGGNGIVFLVVDHHTGQEWAMKSIPKVLSDPKLSDRKRDDHVNAIKREVDVMRRLRGFLNVASLEEAYEDDTHVHLIMEYCRGGELHHRIGAAHYSERTVASFLRATLRTLAQCHANKILHRDIKPGNFLLSSEDERAPLKAVDFGLAVFFDEKQLPRTDLGLEGTPWFMAPETLRSEVFPASDVWAAGVMAHQLLTGRFPFDDRTNPMSPSLSKVWKSILTDELNFSRSHWDGISDEAKDFVKMLLNKDPTKRPTAKEALKHPWLRGRIEERSSGRPLSLAVVQRIQRFSQASLFKRTILEMIAEELLAEQPTVEEDTAAGNDGPACELGVDARPVISHPSASPLGYLYERLRLVDRTLVDRAVLAEGLSEMGYKLTPEEVDNLLDQLDPGNTGHVAKSQLAASQMDWKALQENQTERWFRCARRAFADLDSDKDGLVSTEDMVALLRHKLPPAEVEHAVRQALVEAAHRRETTATATQLEGGENASSHGGSNGVNSRDNSTHNGNQTGNIVITGGLGGSGHGGGTYGSDPSLRNGLNFRQFMRMLHAGSTDSLDLYDDRFGSLGSLGSPERAGSGGNGALGASIQHLGTTPSAVEKVDFLLNRSIKGGDQYSKAGHLDPVPEILTEESP